MQILSEQLTAKFSEMDFEKQYNPLNISTVPWQGSEQNISLQFKDIYISRLKQLEPRLRHIPSVPICEVSDQGNIFIRGIVKRLEKARVRAFEQNYHNKYDTEDTLFTAEDELQVEDHSGKLRIKLNDQCVMAGKHVEAQDLPYGVCIGLRGCFKLRSNKFHTDEIYLPKPIQQNPVRKQQEKMINSGSRFSNSAKSILVMSEPTIWMIKSLVIHFAQKIQGCITESISAVIIVGGPKIVVEELEQFDEVLANLSANIETYVLPSSSQESQIFPGKPYSSLYLPKSRDSLTRCYDPQVFETQNQTRVFVSSGSHVKDMMKNCRTEGHLDAMKRMITFCHYCPTSPFSLRCAPQKSDTFVIEQMPHVMICGQSKYYASEFVTSQQGNVLLVSIPRREMALVCLESLCARRFIT